MKQIHRHGFVRLVDTMPREDLDHAIVQAARVSYGDGTVSVRSDRGLIRYLLRNDHSTPFEMVEFKFHIKMPIFLARQHMRHRTASINEISGRYSVINPEFYYPKEIYDQGKMNKQMSGNKIECKNTNELFQNYMSNSMKQYNIYKLLVDKGVSREMARIGLPQNMYTEFYWSIDLHNLLNFIRLRSAYNAQSEIKEYSDAMKDLITSLVPNTIKSYDKVSCQV